MDSRCKCFGRKWSSGTESLSGGTTRFILMYFTTSLSQLIPRNCTNMLPIAIPSSKSTKICGQNINNFSLKILRWMSTAKTSTFKIHWIALKRPWMCEISRWSKEWSISCAFRWSSASTRITKRAIGRRKFKPKKIRAWSLCAAGMT